MGQLPAGMTACGSAGAVVGMGVGAAVGWMVAVGWGGMGVGSGAAITMRDGLAISRMISRITRLPNKNAGKMVERAFISQFLSHANTGYMQ